MAGLKAGLFFVAMMFVLGRWAPQPAGSVVLWSLFSAGSAVGAWVVWRRLRLPWFTLGLIIALLVSVAMIPISARGLDLATIADALPLPAAIAIWSALAIVPLSAGLESLRESPEWRAWAARTERATLLEMLTFRHVPAVRPGGGPATPSSRGRAGSAGAWRCP